MLLQSEPFIFIFKINSEQFHVDDLKSEPDDDDDEGTAQLWFLGGSDRPVLHECLYCLDPAELPPLLAFHFFQCGLKNVPLFK